MRPVLDAARSIAAARLIREDKTLVMGVLNATPDSFYGPSTVGSASEARPRAEAFIADGADIIDVGGESSRPGSGPVTEEEEQARVFPVIDTLRGLGAIVSVDTWRADTARGAVSRGAVMINDITALRGDPEMARVAAESGALCVLMHMRGLLPRTMQDAPVYDDVVDDLRLFFDERIEYAVRAGISEDRLWIDPGFGFGKTAAHNIELLRRLGEFRSFGLPILVGTSNKSMIGAVLGLGVEDRLEGTAATVALAIAHGADAVRVHDVKAMARVARMCDAILGKTPHG